MRKYILGGWALGVALSTAPLATWAQANDAPPSWAYPVNPPDFKVQLDDGTPRHVPDRHCRVHGHAGSGSIFHARLASFGSPADAGYCRSWPQTGRDGLWSVPSGGWAGRAGKRQSCRSPRTVRLLPDNASPAAWISPVMKLGLIQLVVASIFANRATRSGDRIAVSTMGADLLGNRRFENPPPSSGNSPNQGPSWEMRVLLSPIGNRQRGKVSHVYHEITREEKMIKQQLAGLAGVLRDDVERGVRPDLHPCVASPCRCRSSGCSGIPGSTTTNTTTSTTTDHATTITKGVDANGNEITKKDTYREGVAGGS